MILILEEPSTQADSSENEEEEEKKEENSLNEEEKKEDDGFLEIVQFPNESGSTPGNSEVDIQQKWLQMLNDELYCLGLNDPSMDLSSLKDNEDFMFFKLTYFNEELD